MNLTHQMIKFALVLILAISTPTFVQAQEISNTGNTNTVVSSAWDYIKSFLSIFSYGQAASADVGPQCPKRICQGSGGGAN